MNAIDLYSGVGGWSLGLRFAGIDVLRAYDVWPEAVATYNANLSKSHLPADVRSLPLKSLPRRIQLIVGSPPCTNFSFSNKGGKGDLSEGLKDIIRFLEIVQFVGPRYWVLENVPRTASIIEEGLHTKGHPLFRFRHLKPDIRILDLSSFGLPQTRRRCLVGCFPFELLDSYRRISKHRTLRDVVDALAEPHTVIDPIWANRVKRSNLREHEPEPNLDDEQLRINKTAKQFHPVYNDMSFPDRLDRPARTITATCTRVSRESIVIRTSENKGLRRLTVRERASLQGFPLKYQFFSKSHSSKVKMIGNALPPPFSLLVGLAARGMDASQAERHLRIARGVVTRFCATKPATPTPPDRVASVYPAKRKFRAAVPGLRFKSGMRFELANEIRDTEVNWKIRFFYGSSKDIRTLGLNATLYRRILAAKWLSHILANVRCSLDSLDATKRRSTGAELQRVWTRRARGIGPFEMLDALGKIAGEMTQHLRLVNPEMLDRAVLRILGYSAADKRPSKLLRNASAVLAGFIVGSAFNRTESNPVYDHQSNCSRTNEIGGDYNGPSRRGAKAFTAKQDLASVLPHLGYAHSSGGTEPW